MVCDGLPPADLGFIVAFRQRGDTDGRVGRAVAMGRSFAGMVIVHQDFDLGAAATNAKCTKLR
jgi:hypothetical protein